MVTLARVIVREDKEVFVRSNYSHFRALFNDRPMMQIKSIMKSIEVNYH